jgi:DtxR family Mn-dependent transcriptional regulator
LYLDLVSDSWYKLYMTLNELNDRFPSAPEYLSQILFIGRDYGQVSNSSLAERLDVSRPAVTQAIGRLKKLDLVEQDPYGSIRLSDIGYTLAAEVIKRHFILEHLLVGVLKYPWEKSDEEAERLQNVISADFTDYLYSYLGKPEACPHGNPLPGSKKEALLNDAKRLMELSAGDKGSIFRITEQGEHLEGMLIYCSIHGIQPGKKVQVMNLLDDAVEIKVQNNIVKVEKKFAECIQVLTA